MATYYFDSSASSGGDGSLASPWNQADFDASQLNPVTDLTFGESLTVIAGTLNTTVNQLFATLPVSTESSRGDRLGGEHQTVNSPPGTIVAYGANNQWSYRVVGASGQITLNNDTFNDPIGGIQKSAFVVTSLTINGSSISGSYNINDIAAARPVQPHLPVGCG